MSRLEDLIAKLCPYGVEYRPLGDIIIFDSGYPLNAKELSEDGTYNCIKISEITDGKINSGKNFIHDLPYNIKSTQILHGNEILVGMSGSTGKCGFNYDIENAIVNQRIGIIRNNDRVLNGYLKHLLVNNSFTEYCYKKGTGPQKNISNETIMNYKVPVPPIEVQREIVRILDSFTELTAELTAELQARKHQYEYYRDRLLSFDGDGIAQESVVWKPLSEIADIGTGSSNTNEGLDEGTYPFFVRSQEPLRKNEYEFDETAIITAGDGVGVGKVFHYVEGKYALHQRAYRIHINTPKVLPKYYFYYMESAFLPYISKTMFQGSVPSIRRPMLNKFLVPIPDIETQQRIVSILDRFDALCNDLTSGIPAEIEARQKQYEYYRDKLLNFKRKQA